MILTDLWRPALPAGATLVPWSMAAAGPSVEPTLAIDVPEVRPGAYRAHLEGPGGPVGFGLEVSRGEDGVLRAALVNGLECAPVARVEELDRRVLLHLDPYDSRIEIGAPAADGGLRGQWIRRRGDEPPTRMAFLATPRSGSSTAVRAAMPAGGDPREQIAGRWRVRFASEDDIAVGVFAADPRADAAPEDVVGTFLTTVGDYRYLAGTYRDGGLELTVFDGAHAFRFSAQRGADGVLRGDFWSRDTWHDTWTAERDAEVELPDPFGLSTAAAAVDWGALRFTDLDGAPRALGDPRFAGRARLIVLFGTWCPNCNDETSYLVELDRRYRERGLSILGLAFEFGDDLDRSRDVVRRYAAHHQARYPILVAGNSDKAAASAAFPAIDRVIAYPTTLFVDRAGKIRAVHTGFSGPATGPAHEWMQERFERWIEVLLAE